jgi:hypothetical protein
MENKWQVIVFEELGAKASSTSTGPMKDFALGCEPGMDYP